MIDIIWFIPVGLLCFIAGWLIGHYKWSTACDFLQAENSLLRARINSNDLILEKKQREYDELYDSLLRVNKYNSELMKRLNDSRSTYGELADEIYWKYADGVSRKELCTQYPNVGYSTICAWIRKKAKEYSELSSPANSKPSKLF